MYCHVSLLFLCTLFYVQHDCSCTCTCSLWNNTVVVWYMNVPLLFGSDHIHSLHESLLTCLQVSISYGPGHVHNHIHVRTYICTLNLHRNYAVNLGLCCNYAVFRPTCTLFLRCVYIVNLQCFYTLCCNYAYNNCTVNYAAIIVGVQVHKTETFQWRVLYQLIRSKY